MLEGHSLDPRFRVGVQAFSFFDHLIRAGDIFWQRQNLTGTWPQRVCQFLSWLNWHKQAGWTWSHDDLASISLRADDDVDKVHFTLHQLRNSWRIRAWQNFTQPGRREAAEVTEMPFPAQRYKPAHSWFEKGSSHERAVLSGACVSPARFAVMHKQPIPQWCSYCNSAYVPSWLHLCWECEGFAQSRPPRPHCPLTLALHWPCLDSDYGHLVLQHMAQVRAKCLTDRYDGA